MPDKTIGFIGTGVMGSAMAGHLMDAGYDLVVHNRTPERAQGLVDRGARWADTPAEVASVADVVITIVGYPADVEEVYLGDDGVVQAARPGTLLVDMTTSSPELASRIATAARERGLDAIDAPVSGGDVGARNATLTIMVGGTQAAFDRARPLFEVMGKTCALHGEPGAGQHCKMANQINIASTMLGMAEALAYAKAAGLDPARVIDTLSGGSAQTWTLANYAPRVLGADLKPGFYVKHFLKDLRVALAEADRTGITLPGTQLAKRLYEILAEGGASELGTQAIWLLYASAEERASYGVGADLDVRTLG